MSQLKNINISTPTYREIIPSSKKEISIKPFKVKDEKILLMAAESKDDKQMVDSLKKVVENCTEGVEVDKLASYDIEYLFIKIRSKSVGEIAEIGVKCNNCDTQNSVKVDLGEIVVNTENERVKNIKVNDELIFEMREPNIDDVATPTKDADGVVKFLSRCVNKVYYGEDVIDVSPVEYDDVSNILLQLTSSQFQPFQNYINSMPKVTKEISFTCTHCGNVQNNKLEGLSDFF